MSAPAARLERDFARWLREHVATGDERSLHAAWTLARGELEAGSGVLDTTAPLLRALIAELAARGPVGANEIEACRSEAFVLEALSPFEMSHRGAQEAVSALRRIDEVREQELRRVAHELHDSSGQIFATIHLELSRLAARLDARAASELEHIRALLVRVEEHLRRLAHEFRPAILDDLGLVPALEHLAESVAHRGGLEVRVSGTLPRRLPPEREIVLYRVVQEALTNVLRHAGARTATVHVGRDGGAVTCRVEDDGRGFDPAEAAQRRPGALGLRGMRERLATFGGTLTVDASPGRGTRLFLTLPVEVPHAGPGAGRR